MLTIQEKFPMKKMALYGSTALLVGFAGTLTVLREFAPKDDQNIAEVQPANEQASQANVSNQGSKESTDQSAPPVSSATQQSELVMGNGNLATQPTLRTAPATSSAPADGSTPVVAPSAPATNSTTTEPSGTSQPAPTTTSPPQTSPPPPTSSEPTSPSLTSGLQDTIDDVTGVTDIILKP